MPPQGLPSLSSSSSFVVPWWRRTTIYDIPEPPLEDENRDQVMGDHQPVVDQKQGPLVAKPKSGVVNDQDVFFLCGLDHHGCWNLCWDVNGGGITTTTTSRIVDDTATLTPEPADSSSSEEIRDDPDAATVDKNNKNTDNEVEEESHLNKSTSPTDEKGDSCEKDYATTTLSSPEVATSDSVRNLNDDRQQRLERKLGLTGDGGCDVVGTALLSNVVVLDSNSATLGGGARLATRETAEPVQEVPSSDDTTSPNVTNVVLLEIHSTNRENKNKKEATEQPVELLDQESILGSFDEQGGRDDSTILTRPHDYYIVASNKGSSSFNVTMNPYDDDNQEELGKGETCKCHAPTCKVM